MTDDRNDHQSIEDMIKTSNTTSLIQDAPPTVTTPATTVATKDNPIVTLPSMPTALVGSIVGTRSESGTMVELKGTGSFDVIALSSALEDGSPGGRLRAQTAPCVLSSDGLFVSPTNSTTSTTNTTLSSSAPSSTNDGSSIATTGSSTTTTGGGGTNTSTTTTGSSMNTSLNQTASYVADEDDDEEIRIAMAMALAIQSNPHLTPHEIHELLGTTPPQQKQSFQSLSTGTKSMTTTTNKSAPTAATTASSLLSSFTTATTTSSSNKPSRFTQMFSSFTAATTGTTPTSSDSTTATNSNSTTTTTTTTTTHVAPTLSPIEEKSTTTGSTTTTTTTVSTTQPLSVADVPTITSTPNEQHPPAVEASSYKAPPNLTVVTTTPKNDNNTLLPTAVVEIPSKVVTSVTTGPAMDVITPADNSSTIPSHPNTTVPHIMTSTTTPIAAISPSFTKQISQRSAMLFKSGSLKNTTSGNPATGGGLTQPPKLLPPHVRISGVAWKRRGGMGKYSSSNAWERRRIELVGTKLLYYIIDGNDETNFHASSDDTSHHSRTVEPHALVDTPTTSSGSVTARRGTWLVEHTGINFTSSISSSTVVADGMHKEPRGILDLAKEKATVHAAFGHSGAPTPFALSIKVRAETKWKLCFDRHSIEMDWLAAISDVVIQCSVDAYNGYLLEAADPANHSDFTLFHPPTVKDGPVVTKAAASTPTTISTAIMGSSTQHRLWMLEDYNVSNVSQNSDVKSDETFLPYMDEKPNERDMSGRTDNDVFHVAETLNSKDDNVGAKDTEVVETQVYESTTTIDHDMIQDTILNESNQHWVVPQEKLPHVLLIVNVALFYARASSTSISGFWSMFVGTNFAILLCFVKEPTWESLVNLINSAPATKSVKSISSATKVSTRSAPIMESTTLQVTVAANHEKSNMRTPTSGNAASTNSGYIPVAGCTSVHLKVPTDIPQNAKGEMFAGWCTVPGEILAIRSHGYALTKKKVPSPGELYECIHLEVFESPQRYPDMAKRVKLPKVEFDDDAQLKTWRCPDLFIISIALPTDPPRMGKTSSDGGGYTITMYYRMKEETREILRRVTAEGYDPSSEVIKEDEIQTSKVNAVRLLEEWIRRAPTDHKFQSRFKIVPNAHNLKEIGMPSWISKYNGKPFLIKRPGVTGFLFAHPELSCVEFDVSLHPFPYLAKQAICFMKESYFKKVLVSFGFVIEGRADDELPECLIGLVQLCYPDPQYAIQAADFFNGTAQRSF